MTCHEWGVVEGTPKNTLEKCVGIRSAILAAELRGGHLLLQIEDSPMLDSDRVWSAMVTFCAIVNSHKEAVGVDYCTAHTQEGCECGGDGMQISCCLSKLWKPGLG